ncbi:ABC-type transport auxiliary lipoprotein family protein [Desulfolutivibrio sp.]|uniref:ABC-type transport auxiliary lipoprotein family protein n=1 Tax=Desulfolutivibrio sp. TaxID=2773296 RepID=UPI002F963111
MFIKAAAAAGLLLMAGCLGSAPPVEHYLRVEAATAGCDKGAGHATATPGVVVAYMDLTALDNLDRPAVLVANGSVLAPSTRWYWEGAPQDVMGGGIIRAVNCQPGVAGVLKYRPRVEHQAVLSGNVTAFNVQRKNGLRFVAGVRLELWTKDARRLVGSRDFAVETPIASETPEAIADAASRAVSRIAAEAVAWLTAGMGGPLAESFAESAK